MGIVIDLLPFIEKKRAVTASPDEFYFYLDEEDEVWIAEINGTPTYFADSFNELMEKSGWDISSFDDDEELEYEEM